MILIAYILLFGALIYMVFQDLMQRAISIWLFPVLAVGSMLFFLSQESGEWQGIILNTLFVTTLIFCLFLYISIKQMRFVNIFKTHFGLGDALFLLAITPMFSVRNMVIYVVLGMMFSILLHLLFQSLAILNNSETVPLAGYLAIFLISVLIADVFFSHSLFYTDLLS